MGGFKVADLERIYRTAPAVTDCKSPDQWSCGKKWDSRWSSQRCQRAYAVTACKTNSQWVSFSQGMSDRDFGYPLQPSTNGNQLHFTKLAVSPLIMVRFEKFEIWHAQHFDADLWDVTMTTSATRRAKWRHARAQNRLNDWFAQPGNHDVTNLPSWRLRRDARPSVITLPTSGCMVICCPLARQAHHEPEGQ